MTFEEFKEDQFKKTTSQYWKERAGGEDVNILFSYTEEEEIAEMVAGCVEEQTDEIVKSAVSDFKASLYDGLEIDKIQLFLDYKIDRLDTRNREIVELLENIITTVSNL